MEKDNILKKAILLLQIVLTLFGTILAIVLFIRSLKEPSLLGVLGSTASLITYLAIIIYTTVNYKKKENIYFQSVIYAYVAVFGIQILQAGNFITGYGLTENVALIINCCNLISFANIIRFGDTLETPKVALSYIIIAIILKLAVEILLIIKMFAFIQLIHVLMSLSIPILGITIIVAYIYRMRRMN